MRKTAGEMRNRQRLTRFREECPPKKYSRRGEIRLLSGQAAAGSMWCTFAARAPDSRRGHVSPCGERRFLRQDGEKAGNRRTQASPTGFERTIICPRMQAGIAASVPADSISIAHDILSDGGRYQSSESSCRSLMEMAFSLSAHVVIAACSLPLQRRFDT